MGLHHSQTLPEDLDRVLDESILKGRAPPLLQRYGHWVPVSARPDALGDPRPIYAGTWGRSIAMEIAGPLPRAAEASVRRRHVTVPTVHPQMSRGELRISALSAECTPH
jgi:hypothetical protein